MRFFCTGEGGGGGDNFFKEKYFSVCGEKRVAKKTSVGRKLFSNYSVAWL